MKSCTRRNLTTLTVCCTLVVLIDFNTLLLLTLDLWTLNYGSTSVCVSMAVGCGMCTRKGEENSRISLYKCESAVISISFHPKRRLSCAACTLVGTNQGTTHPESKLAKFSQDSFEVAEYVRKIRDLPCSNFP